MGSGYVVKSLEAALWGFHRSEYFKEGCQVMQHLRSLCCIDSTDAYAVIDLFWNNSSLNDLATRIEVSMDVPSGLYMYSQDGAMACAAGRCQGSFTAPPGNVRNMPIIIKADSPGNYFIHMNGRYWPENDRDGWTPMSLSTPIRVMEPSPKPGDARPTSDLGTAPGGSALEAGADTGKAWWLTPMALVMWALMAIVVVVLAGYRAISRTVRAARSEPPTIEIG